MLTSAREAEIRASWPGIMMRELLAEIDRLRAELDLVSHTENKEISYLIKERDALRARVGKLRAALSHISEQPNRIGMILSTLTADEFPEIAMGWDIATAALKEDEEARNA